MPDAIGKVITSYLSSVKAVAPEPAYREPVEPIGHREPGPSKSVEVTISQEAMNRRKSDRS